MLLSTSPTRPSVWKSGNREIQKSGNREIQELWNLEIQKFGIPKVPKTFTDFQNQIPFCPKMLSRSGVVGKILLAPFGAISGQFFHGPDKCKKSGIFVYSPWWSNRQPLLLSTLGGVVWCSSVSSLAKQGDWSFALHFGKSCRWTSSSEIPCCPPREDGSKGNLLALGKQQGKI